MCRDFLNTGVRYNFLSETNLSLTLAVSGLTHTISQPHITEELHG